MNTSIDRLYNHVLQLEGIRHHRTDPQRLNKTAEYIKHELESYGVKTSEQTFQFEGIDQIFRNIEGLIGSGNKPEILITSHYDTVENTPGANDNASAVASMLEAARILAAQPPTDYNIRLVSFTLEELHPQVNNAMHDKLLELELIDERNRYKTHSMHKSAKTFHKTFFRQLGKGKTYSKAAQFAYDQIKADLNSAEREYFQFLLNQHGRIKKAEDWLGKVGLVGSNMWAEQANGKPIIGVLNLETVGYTSDQAHSQRLPSPLFRLLPKYRVNTGIGNFIAVIADKNSRGLAESFCGQCRELELPYTKIALPFGFKFIAAHIRDLLRSDHGPFWKVGIPALMITDTANMRYPFYHTEADTIDKLDFEFMEKVCRATIACALNPPR